MSLYLAINRIAVTVISRLIARSLYLSILSVSCFPSHPVITSSRRSALISVEVGGLALCKCFFVIEHNVTTDCSVCEFTPTFQLRANANCNKIYLRITISKQNFYITDVTLIRIAVGFQLVSLSCQIGVFFLPLHRLKKVNLTMKIKITQLKRVSVTTCLTDSTSIYVYVCVSYPFPQ